MKLSIVVGVLFFLGSAHANWLKLPSLAIRKAQEYVNIRTMTYLEPPIQSPTDERQRVAGKLEKTAVKNVNIENSEESSEEEENLVEKIKLPPPSLDKKEKTKYRSLLEDFEKGVLNRNGFLVQGEVYDTSFDQDTSHVDTSMLRENPETPIEEIEARMEEKERPSFIGGLLKSEKVAIHKVSNRPWESRDFDFSALPESFDWRNVNGTNYCSPNRNQHIPVYCGSCWVFGTTGMLNDRFNVAKKGRWPMTMVSPQEIIDCGGKGNCQGGTVGDVLEHAQKNGLVEEGCNVYRATNGECSPFHRCGSCWPNNCFPLTNYTRYYVKEYAPINGTNAEEKRNKMKAEIAAGGPIACAIGATKKFEYEYTKGVYYEESELESNHIVTVSGWGVENGNEYWIVRNSWGDAWGETGWFRVVTSAFREGNGDKWNMGIERECYWAEVDVSNL